MGKAGDCTPRSCHRVRRLRGARRKSQSSEFDVAITEEGIRERRWSLAMLVPSVSPYSRTHTFLIRVRGIGIYLCRRDEIYRIDTESQTTRGVPELREPKWSVPGVQRNEQNK